MQTAEGRESRERVEQVARALRQEYVWWIQGTAGRLKQSERGENNKRMGSGKGEPSHVVSEVTVLP